MNGVSSAGSDFLSTAQPKYPYPGLRPFEAEEWSIFFGRERMIDEVIDRLAAHHLVLIHGSSGCGKSSLVRAGVLPKLARMHLRAGAPWQTCIIRPSNGPLWNLATEFARLEGTGNDATRIGQIASQFNRRGATLSAVAASLKGLDGQRLCILVDQFEELFRFEKETSREEAELFVDLLVRSDIHEAEISEGTSGSRAQEVPVHVVVTMRSEFLGECARFDGLAEAINRTQFLVPRMDHEALLRAVRRPAQIYGWEVSLELAERLIADVARGEDELPLIQHGLMYMWNAGPAKSPDGKDVLNAAPLEAAGGLAQLLSNHADAVVKEAARDEPERRSAIERLFRALSDLNEEGRAIRRPQAFGRLAAVTQIDKGKLREIIDVLRRDGVSFLLPPEKEPIADDTRIDIAHESLIRQWKTLATWVADEARNGQGWRNLLKATQEGLLAGSRLAGARSFWDDVRPTPAWAERHGGGFESVVDLIRDSVRRRRINFGAGAGVAAVILALLGTIGYVTYSSYLRELEQAEIANRSFQRAVKSTKNLLDNVGSSLNRGDVTAKGANDLLGAATEIVEGMPNAAPTRETIVLLANLKWTAFDIEYTLGQYERAYNTAKSARDVVTPLVATDPNNPANLSLLYSSIWRMGDSYADRSLEQEDQKRGLEYYKEAEQLALRLVDLAPNDGARQRNLSFVLGKIGDVYQGQARRSPSAVALEKWTAAIDVYRKALPIMRQVADGAPDNWMWQRDLGHSISRLGQALQGGGQLDSAMVQFQEALKIRTTLAARYKGNDGLQANKGSSHREIARLYVQLGKRDLAVAEYQRAIDILVPLYTKDPTNAIWQNSLAPWYAEYGALLKQTNPAAALEQYRKAYLLKRELAWRDPGVKSRQHAFAEAGIAVADLLVSQNQNTDEAIKLYRDAIATMDDLALAAKDAPPLRSRYDLKVFRCYMNIGYILKARSDSQDALQEYEKASDIARKSATADAANVPWQTSLAESYTTIGALLISRGRTSEARNHYQRALTFVEGLAAQHSDIAAWASLVQSLKAEIEKLAETR